MLSSRRAADVGALATVVPGVAEAPARTPVTADGGAAEPPLATIPAAARTRAIAISNRVMGLARDTAAGVLLCQLIYWTRRGVDVLERDGWIYKTAQEWQQETGMSWKIQRRARSLLVELDLLEEHKLRMPARLEYRLKLSTLLPLLAQRAELVAAPTDLASFRNSQNLVADDLIGRAFLFHGALARVFPVHSAMMCSRLLAPARLASVSPQALIQAASRSVAGCTRLVALHRDEWRYETGLSRDQWQTARRNLRESGVLVERRHNFPRRVDLAIDMRALAEVLRQHGSRAPAELDDFDGADATRQLDVEASGSYRLDRAKQAGGIGHHPIPPSQSPDPADKDRPIQPLRIDRSHLYPMGLQGVHPQPQSASAPEAPSVDFAAGLWGGGVYGKPEIQYRLNRKEVPVAAEPAPALVWPKAFSPADQELTVQHLAGLDRAIQQTVLDEIDWISSSGKAIRSPIALARTLARKARHGEFVPDGAHRVATARAQTAAEAETRRLDAERRGRPPQPAEPLSTEAEAARARLKELTAAMKRRSA